MRNLINQPSLKNVGITIHTACRSFCQLFKVMTLKSQKHKFNHWCRRWYFTEEGNRPLVFGFSGVKIGRLVASFAYHLVLSKPSVNEAQDPAVCL